MSKQDGKSRSPEAARESARERLKDLAPGFGARVEAAVDTFPSIALAAKAIGIGYNQVRRIIDEETVPSFPAMALLAKKSGYRFEWLAFGEKPEKSSIDDGAFPQRGPGFGERLAERFIWVPEYDARISAGHGAHNHDVEEIRSVFPVPVSMIEGMGVMPERLRLVEATGDSMLPDIRDGDRLIIVIDEDSLRDGAIYVLNFGDDTLVKQIQIEPDGGVTLLSKNPTFAPRRIAADDRQAMSIGGRVIGAIKRFV